MTIESTIRIVAGFSVLISLVLAAQASPIFHSANWLWFTALVGLNPFQSGYQCSPMETMLKNLGMKMAGSVT